MTKVFVPAHSFQISPGIYVPESISSHALMLEHRPIFKQAFAEILDETFDDLIGMSMPLIADPSWRSTLNFSETGHVHDEILHGSLAGILKAHLKGGKEMFVQKNAGKICIRTPTGWQVIGQYVMLWKHSGQRWLLDAVVTRFAQLDTTLTPADEPALAELRQIPIGLCVQYERFSEQAWASAGGGGHGGHAGGAPNN